MARQTVPINGDVLRWALDESGLTPDEAATRLEVSPEVMEAWIAGSLFPSRGEFSRLAKLLKRPPSILLLPRPPELSGLPPSLRRAVGRGERPLESDELREIRRARRAQRLVSWLLRDAQSTAIQMPRIEVGSDPQIAGARIRTWLDVSEDAASDWDTPKKAFDAWRAACEASGLLVMQLQLGKGGLRGFSIPDDHAPLVAVNTAENLPARCFSLLHEVAHLASGTESACLAPPVRNKTDRSVERWCEDTASAALLPAGALSRRVRTIRGRVPNLDTIDLVRRVADYFKASLRATAVALEKHGLVPDGTYDDIDRLFPAGDSDKGFARGQAQRAPQRRVGEMGVRTASIVLDAFESERLTERDARSYLRLDGNELAALFDEVAASR